MHMRMRRCESAVILASNVNCTHANSASGAEKEEAREEDCEEQGGAAPAQRGERAGLGEHRCKDPLRGELGEEEDDERVEVLGGTSRDGAAGMWAGG